MYLIKNCFLKNIKIKKNFYKLYNLQKPTKKVKRTPIKWTEEYFFNFFEKNILPKCKNGKMLKKSKILKLGKEYVNWKVIFHKYKYPNRFASKEDFLKIYNLK